MLDLSIAIMAHPSRERFVKDLEQDLDAPHKVIWDDQDNEWETAKRAWQVGTGEGADYHLVIQDDAIPCRDFARIAAAATQEALGSPVSFYTGAGRPFGSVIGPAVHRALKTGRPWLSMRGPLWGVAVAIPTEHIKSMIRACSKMEGVLYDERLQRWYTDRVQPCWYTVPSLVQHREGPSLISHDLQGVRRAAYVWEEWPKQMNFATMPLQIGDPNQPFRVDGSKLVCSACDHEAVLVPEMAEHVAEEHGSLDRIDYLALDAESAEIFSVFHANTPLSIRGNLWVLGRHLRDAAGSQARWLKKATAARTLRIGGEWPIVVSGQEAFPYIGARPVVSMDGHECPTDLIVDHPGVKVHA